MRLAALSLSIAVAHVVFAPFLACAQQTPGTSGELPARPAMSGPPSTATVGAAPLVSRPPLPAGGAAKSREELVPLTPVKAAPCSISARETDGTTTCIGLPSERRAGKRRR